MKEADYQRRVEDLLAEAKRIAIDYYHLTGKPLGVTGELAEYNAAKILNLKLADARTPGYDAFRGSERIHIKGRRVLNKKSQRVPSINFKHEWDFVMLVLMDAAYEAYEIYEAPRAAVQIALAKPGSKARERGSMAVSQFKSISKKTWSRG